MDAALGEHCLVFVDALVGITDNKNVVIVFCTGERPQKPERVYA